MRTREVKLGDLITYNKGYAFKSNEYTNNGKMVVRVTDFTLDSISDNNSVYLEPNDKYKKFIINTNDILIQTVGSWANNPNSIVGKVVRVPGKCDKAYLNQNIVRIIPNKDFNNTYLYYALKANQFSMYCVLRGQGSANQASITLDTIFRFKFKAHFFSEQKKIADILSTYDKLIENNNKRIKRLEKMAENLYKEWFVRFRFPGYEDVEFVNGIPEGWEIKKIKNCVERLPFNRLYKQNELESKGKVIVIDQSSAEILGYHNNEPSHYASIDKPILLFGDHSCKFVFMIRDFSLGENVVPFISKNVHQINNYYLFYAVHKIIVTEEYKRHWGRFTAMKILVPTYEVQLMFMNFIKPMIQMKNKLWNENQLLIKQRDRLLPRLMSGKLEV